MDLQHSDELKLVGEVIRAVNIVGVDKTRAHIKLLYDQNMRFDDPKVEEVVNKVAEEFSMAAHEIILGTGRNNERTLAIGFCSYYLTCHFDCRLPFVVDKLKKNKVLLGRYMGRIKKLSPTHPASRKYFAIKTKLDIVFPIKK